MKDLAGRIEQMKQDLEEWRGEGRPGAVLRFHSEHHIRPELDAMERILARGGAPAEALIGGLRVMLRDIQGT